MVWWLFLDRPYVWATKCHENYWIMLHRNSNMAAEYAIEKSTGFTKSYRIVRRHHILMQFSITMMMISNIPKHSWWYHIPTVQDGGREIGSNYNFGCAADRNVISNGTTMFLWIAVTIQYRLCNNFIEIYDKFNMAAGSFNMAAGFLAAILNFMQILTK